MSFKYWFPKAEGRLSLSQAQTGDWGELWIVPYTQSGCSHLVLAGDTASSSGGNQPLCQRAILGVFDLLAEM